MLSVSATLAGARVSQGPSNGTLHTGDPVTLTLTSSEPVTVNGIPTLNDGGTATYDGAKSTPTSLVFDYTVGSGDQNVPALAVVSVNLPTGARIKDTAGNTIVPSVAGLGQSGPVVAPSFSLFGSITHDVAGTAGEVYALYETVLGRAPDATGFERFVALAALSVMRRLPPRSLASSRPPATKPTANQPRLRHHHIRSGQQNGDERSAPRGCAGSKDAHTGPRHRSRPP